MIADILIQEIAAILRRYTYPVLREEDLQVQIDKVLTAELANAAVHREWRQLGPDGLDRFDFLVERQGEDWKIRVVLELKIKGSAAAFERQAMRYAQYPSVDAVVLVTTSQRLAATVAHGNMEGAVAWAPGTWGAELNGKRFGTITLRTF